MHAEILRRTGEKNPNVKQNTNMKKSFRICAGNSREIYANVNYVESAGTATQTRYSLPRITLLRYYF